MNIIWLRPDGGIAITHVVNKNENLKKHAVELQRRKDVPRDWIVKATGITLPVDRLFRNAWRISDQEIKVALMEAKKIAHSRRRSKRSVAFAPYDEIVAKQIPGTGLEAAETERQKIRGVDAVNQSSLNAASNEDELRATMDNIGLID